MPFHKLTKIEQIYKIYIKHQHLSHDEEKLENENTLKDCGIGKNAILFLILRENNNINHENLKTPVKRRFILISKTDDPERTTTKNKFYWL
mgnify:CR=1 FL=1